MVGQSEIGLLGVHSRLEQTAHILLHTTATQNEMNTNAFFFFHISPNLAKAKT